MVGPGLALDARFVLVKNVSRGSYGVVWSARDLITNQVVAIKLVPKFQESDKLFEASSEFPNSSRAGQLDNTTISRYNLVLIDFGLAAKFRDPTTGNRIPVPHAGLDFLSVPYSPPRAAAGSEYLETEDLVSAAIVAVYMAFESPSSVPWYAQNALAMQRKKLHFGKYPEIYLPNHRCLAPVIKIINSQEYGATPDYQSILTFIQHTLGEMNCSTELNLHL